MSSFILMNSEHYNSSLLSTFYTHTHTPQMSVSEVTKVDTTRLQSQISQLEEEIKRKDEKIEEVTQTLTLLDQEHDTLRGQCDTKDEVIAQLKTELQHKVSLYRTNNKLIKIIKNNKS